jgi:glycosyltransferase involved in cell wall biosynthesis
MVIGIDIRHLSEEYPSGVGIYTRRILDSLARADSEHRYHLLSAGRRMPKLPAHVIECTHMTHEHIRIPSKLFSLIMKLRLRTLESYSGLPVESWWLPNINFSHTHLPYAITVHDMSFRIRPSWFSPKARAWHTLLAPKRLISHATRVITPSRATKQDLISFNWAHANHIHLAPHGAPDIEGRQQPHDRHTLKRLGIEGEYFIAIGTMEPRKNLIALIKAFERYRSAGGELRLVLAGKPGFGARKLMRYISNSPESRHITRLSYVSDAEKWSLLRLSSGLVFPSLYEGYGMPVVEALQAETPVLTSAHSSLIEFSSSNILYADPFSISDLTEGLKLLEKHEHQKDSALPSWNHAAQLTAKAIISVLQ